MKRNIYYYDTDCGGVVYHANYLRFFEEARTEELEKMGLTVKKLMEDNCYFVVNHQEIFYRAPAMYGDVIDVQAYPIEMSPVRLVYEYQIFNQDGKLLTEGTTSLACVGKEGRLGRWPQYFRDVVKLEPSRIKRPIRK